MESAHQEKLFSSNPEGSRAFKLKRPWNDEATRERAIRLSDLTTSQTNKHFRQKSLVFYATTGRAI
jgi:hypothetical protein